MLAVQVKIQWQRHGVNKNKWILTMYKISLCIVSCGVNKDTLKPVNGC